MDDNTNMALRYEREIPEGYEARIEGNKVIFELRESEDERIGKELLNHLRQEKNSATLDINREKWSKMIAYLEKLKEQKPINECNTHELTLDEARKWNEVYEKGYSLGYENGRNEQKPAENLSKEEYVKRFKALCDAYEIKLPNREYDIYHLCDDLSKLSMDSGKQKPAEWGEEDESRLSHAITTLAENVKRGSAREDFEFLASLPRRFNLQPKTEWSEEDKAFLQRTISVIGWAGCCTAKYRIINTDGAAELQSWLEGLPNRFSLQPHWKPSEEQMEALRVVLEHEAKRMGSSYELSLANSLYEQLKAL